jgi:hypothetical protein
MITRSYQSVVSMGCGHSIGLNNALCIPRPKALRCLSKLRSFFVRYVTGDTEQALICSSRCSCYQQVESQMLQDRIMMLISTPLYQRIDVVIGLLFMPLSVGFIVVLTKALAFADITMSRKALEILLTCSNW